MKMSCLSFFLYSIRGAENTTGQAFQQEPVRSDKTTKAQRSLVLEIQLRERRLRIVKQAQELHEREPLSCMALCKVPLHALQRCILVRYSLTNPSEVLQSHFLVSVSYPRRSSRILRCCQPDCMQQLCTHDPNFILYLSLCDNVSFCMQLRSCNSDLHALGHLHPPKRCWLLGLEASLVCWRCIEHLSEKYMMFID